MSTAAALSKRLLSGRYSWLKPGTRTSSGTSSAAGDQHDPFKVLGVSRTASEQEIRDAFRQAAKRCHPDMHPDPKSEAQFKICLLAYQSLIKRISQPAGTSRERHSSAKRKFSEHLREAGLWRITPGAAEHDVAHMRTGMCAIDRVFEEVQESVQQVYTGPSLQGLAESELPLAFEAEHRSSPSHSLDLLQIVSGSTLLGSVTCSTLAALPAAAPSHTLLEESKPDGLQPSGDSSSNHSPNAHNEHALDAPEPCTPGAHHSGSSTDEPSHFYDSSGVAIQMSELAFSVGGMEQVKAIQYTHSDTKWLEVQCSLSGEALGYVFSDAISDAQGNVTHRIKHINTPGVLKMFILNRATGRVVLKASRTWLPDHRFWLVPPRTVEYSTGGWYIERTGPQESQGSKVHLHPGVACCLLGVQALEFEAGINVPWWLKGTLQAAQRDIHLLT